MKRFLVFLAVVLIFASGSALAQAKPRHRRFARAQSKLTVTFFTHMHVTWVASVSTTDGSCVAPCVIGYNLFRGTTAGGENMTTPVNPMPLFATLFDDMSANVPGTYFYVIQTVKFPNGLAGSGTPPLTVNSPEISGVFPKPIVTGPTPATGGVAIAQ